MNKVIEYLKGIPLKGSVLDIATGQGEFVSFMNENFGEDIEKITAIDFSEKILERARDNFKEFDKKIDFKPMDAYNLSFKDENFDVVTISNSLHHFDNPELILIEILRVLKKDGYLLVNEMICDNLTKSQQSHMKFHHWSARIDKAMGISHNNTYSKQVITDLVKSNIGNSNEIKEFEYAYKVENLFDEELMKQLSGYFDIINKRVESIDNDEKVDKQAIITEGEEIKKWIETHGYSPATSVFFVIMKR